MSLKRDRKGAFLPAVLGLLLLMSLSVLLIANFGSQTRAILGRAQENASLGLLLRSALLEARCSLDDVLRGPSHAWPAPWRAFLRGAGARTGALPDLAVPSLTGALCHGKVSLSPVRVVCLHVAPFGKGARGLMALTVEARSTAVTRSPITLRREERLRFRVLAATANRPGRILLDPIPLCARESQ